MPSLQSICWGSVKLGSAASCCATGLEWEEIESSEGPTLLSLQPSAPNGQVAVDYNYVHAASGVHFTEQCAPPQDHAAGLVFPKFMYALATCQSLFSTDRSAFSAKPAYLLLTETMPMTETRTCRRLHHPHSSCQCQCL